MQKVTLKQKCAEGNLETKIIYAEGISMWKVILKQKFLKMLFLVMLSRCKKYKFRFYFKNILFRVQLIPCTLPSPASISPTEYISQLISLLLEAFQQWLEAFQRWLGITEQLEVNLIQPSSDTDICQTNNVYEYTAFSHFLSITVILSVN